MPDSHPIFVIVRLSEDVSVSIFPQEQDYDISICPGIKAAPQARGIVLRPGGVSWFLGFSLLVKCSCDQTVRAAIIDHKYQTLEFNSELTLATDFFSSSHLTTPVMIFGWFCEEKCVYLWLCVLFLHYVPTCGTWRT